MQEKVDIQVDADLKNVIEEIQRLQLMNLKTGNG
jgi:hypothetical protein